MPLARHAGAMMRDARLFIFLMLMPPFRCDADARRRAAAMPLRVFRRFILMPYAIAFFR